MSASGIETVFTIAGCFCLFAAACLLVTVVLSTIVLLGRLFAGRWIVHPWRITPWAFMAVGGIGNWLLIAYWASGMAEELRFGIDPHWFSPNFVLMLLMGFFILAGISALFIPPSIFDEESPTIAP